MTELEEMLKQQNEFLQKTVESLNANIAALTEEIKVLKEQLHKNSHNSSKPPQATDIKNQIQKASDHSQIKNLAV